MSRCSSLTRKEAKVRISRLALGILIVIPLAACVTRAPAPTLRGGEAAAEALVGKWHLQSVPPQRMPGLQMTVTVDSACGTRYFGHLSHYFSGNVGQDVRYFRPFADSIATERRVTFDMPATDSTKPSVHLEGTLSADTIAVERFVLGPDTLSAGPRRWYLTRKSDPMNRVEQFYLESDSS